jgi:SWI/SNF-related matrix-associated actin-dependent regulator 1 of chromatin subfamily A
LIWLIIDELHRLKDGSTQQSKFAMGITKGKEWVLGLTGTPVVNKPKDLVAQLHIIGRLAEMGGYKFFMDRYCGGNGSGATNLSELSYKLQTTCFYQRQKKEVLTELPDKMRQIVLCDITTSREYQDALKDLSTYLADYRKKTDEEVARSMRGEIMVKIGVCKNISARGKINDVIEHIDEVVAAGEKIGVFIHQKEIAAALKAHYPHALTITGSDSQDARQNAVDSFQNKPECNIILLSIKAAGVGLTLTAASRCAFVELPWHAADCDQCEDRFHRIGQKDSVQCAYFLGKDTIDEDIYQLIEKKRTIANSVMGAQDNVQKEIIDRVMNSIFNDKAA